MYTLLQVQLVIEAILTAIVQEVYTRTFSEQHCRYIHQIVTGVLYKLKSQGKKKKTAKSKKTVYYCYTITLSTQ